MQQIVSQRMLIFKNFRGGHAPGPHQETHDLRILGTSPPNKSEIEPASSLH